MVSNAFVALGSNLDNPEAQLRRALAALATLPQTVLHKVSGLYVTPPMGPQDQDDFVNAAVWLMTTLDAETLFVQLQQIEQQQGRERCRHWGPRTLDLDLLLFADEVIDLPHLQIPHYGIAARSFVLLPLHDLVGDHFRIPRQKQTLGELMARLPQAELASLREHRLIDPQP